MEVDEECWRKTAEMARTCREAGVTVPLSDVLASACAQRHRVGMLEKDEHFGMIDKAMKGQ